MSLSQDEFFNKDIKMKKFSTKAIGDKGEKYAADYLKKKKYKILALNYRKRCGEIDIIAENKQTLVFVEVKTRHNNSYLDAALAVDRKKQIRIIKTALLYISENKIDKFCRFDVCEVYVDPENLKLEKINYIENAFE